MRRNGSADDMGAFGRYRLLEHLGRGGMADVYKAKSFGVEGFEKVLVIKRILPELAVHDEFVDMFIREAKLAVRLSHANIVQVFDLGRIDATGDEPPSYYIAMEYVDGLDLATVLRQLRAQQQLVSLGMATFVATEIAKALDHAHRRRDEQGRALAVVHRDISPHNVLVSWDGDVKVTDFGIAKAVEAITRDEEQNELEARRAAGKIAYLSPEQARALSTDARGDLFSLGVVLYEMIAGHNPFHAPTTTETMRRIAAGEYPPVNLQRTDVPEALVAIVDRLLAVDPEDRISSAGELCEQLLTLRYESAERFGATDLAGVLTPLRERRRSLDLPASVVLADPSTAGDKTPIEIPQLPSAPSGRDGGAGQGARREVTVLVVAFGGRAGLVPAEAPARVREILERHGARVRDQTTTQISAVFGLGDPDGRDAEAAVRAGLVAVRERFGDAVPSAGIHAGPVSLDPDGNAEPDERLATLLATAQALSRVTEGQVVLSPLAARLVRRIFVFEPLPLTGHAVPASGFLVRAAQAVDVTQGRFVGRRAELRTLGAILAASTRREPQLVIVTGDTGIGKSRFLTEAKRRLERGNFNVACYQAACPLHGATASWSALRAMLHVLGGTQEDDPPERIAEIGPRLRALSLGEEQTSAVLQLLGAHAAVREADSARLLRGAFERMVSSLCQDRLHCLTWDDAHHMDRDTLDVLLKILRHPGGLALTIVLATRGEPPDWLMAANPQHVLAIGELTEQETARFLETQLGVRAVPAELLHHVRSIAGGHPLFLDELGRDLLDSGAVRVLSGQVQFSVDAKQAAPRTLRTLIASRVDRLPDAERRVLQAAAVLGSPAFGHVLAAVLDVPMPLLDRELASLGAKGLLRRTGPTKVRFAAPLYREIVLDATARATYQELHARAAETYQRVSFSPAGGDTLERVAEHLCEAGRRSEAVDFFWQAAEQKLADGQLEPAVRSMLHALELAELAERPVEQLVSWLSTLSRTVSQVRSAPGLRDTGWKLVRQIETRGDRVQRGRAYVDLARALGAVNLFDEAYRAFEQADLDSTGDVALRREGLVAEINVSYRQGLFVRAASAADRLEELGPIDDATTLMAIAQARGAAGQAELGHKLLDQVDARCEPAHAVEAVARLKQRCLLYFNSRDFEAAAHEARQLAKLARSAGLRYDTAAALHNLGDALDRLGDHARAYAAFMESLDLTRLIDHERLGALNQMHLHLLDGLRNVEGSGERLKALIRYADSRGYLWDVLEGRFLLARLALHGGARDEARQHLEQVLTLAEEQGHELVAVDARELLASL